MSNGFAKPPPYIHAFRGRVFVIAFGGEVLSDGKFANLSHDLNVLVSLGVRIVLVHGARPQVEAILQQYGQGQRFHLSRRVTDLAGLEIVKQAVGYTRAEIESWLSMALPNSPMAGANLRVASGNYVIGGRRGGAGRGRYAVHRPRSASWKPLRLPPASKPVNW